MEILDGLAVQGVFFTFAAEPIESGVAEFDFLGNGGAETGVMAHERFLGDLRKADALDLAGGAGEGKIGQFAAEADGFEDLRALIALEAGDPHF